MTVRGTSIALPAVATLGDATGVATITNDDTQPAISISDVTVTEDNGGTTNAVFTVSLLNASYQTVRVKYATSDDSATASSDYTAVAATLLTSIPAASKTWYNNLS